VKYEIIFSPRASKELRALHRLPIGRRLSDAIDALADNPRPRGCIKTTAQQTWRIRVGDYRVVYDIDDVVRIVAIDRVEARGSVYER